MRNPTSTGLANQLLAAFAYDSSSIFLVRDRDTAYGTTFRRRLKNMGIRDVVTSYKSPWQNCYAERVIGSVRRECLDHMIVLNEMHLARLLREYQRYYNTVRPHLSLDRNSPVPRQSVSPEDGGVVTAEPFLGGLHHRYSRAA